MGEVTGISWVDKTWSPWLGCQKVGPACDGCYAEHLMDTRLGRVDWGPHGERVRTSASYWKQLRTWNRQAAAAGRQTTVFPSLCDPFDKKAPPGALRDYFDEIRATPHLTHLLLTKRPQNILRLWAQVASRNQAAAETWSNEPFEWPRNAAIGCTVVTQEEADRDVPHLLRAKAALKPAFAFLSMEPLLGPVDLTRVRRFSDAQKEYVDALRGSVWTDQSGLPNPDPRWAKPGVPFIDGTGGLDWVITGGETDQGGHKARPTHPDWILSIRDQCVVAGVPYHHKQHGEWLPARWMGDDLNGAIYRPAPRRDPEATRRCKVEHTVMHSDGSLHSGLQFGDFAAGSGAMSMFKVGKKRSGRLLDGVLHDAMPEAAG